jgi:hypothetical protein
MMQLYLFTQPLTLFPYIDYLKELECCNEHLLVPDFSHFASEISCKAAGDGELFTSQQLLRKISRADSKLPCVTADSMLNIGLHLGCSRSGEKIMVAKTIAST